MNTKVCISLYLAAVVLGNLAAAKFGPLATPVIALVAIGLDLTMRDLLHERWHGRLLRNMALLILTGTVLSGVLNIHATRIALASALAFGASATVDTIVYQMLHHRSKQFRVNMSNIASGLVDSLIFPAVAFGAWLPMVVLAQWSAKVFGGWLWSLALRKQNNENYIHKEV